MEEKTKRYWRVVAYMAIIVITIFCIRLVDSRMKEIISPVPVEIIFPVPVPVEIIFPVPVPVEIVSPVPVPVEIVSPEPEPKLPEPAPAPAPEPKPPAPAPTPEPKPVPPASAPPAPAAEPEKVPFSVHTLDVVEKGTDWAMLPGQIMTMPGVLWSRTFEIQGIPAGSLNVVESEGIWKGDSRVENLSSGTYRYRLVVLYKGGKIYGEWKSFTLP